MICHTVPSSYASSAYILTEPYWHQVLPVNNQFGSASFHLSEQPVVVMNVWKKRTDLTLPQKDRQAASHLAKPAINHNSPTVPALHSLEKDTGKTCSFLLNFPDESWIIQIKKPSALLWSRNFLPCVSSIFCVAAGHHSLLPLSFEDP